MLPLADQDLLPVWQCLPERDSTSVSYFLWKTRVLLQLHRYSSGKLAALGTLAREGRSAWARLATSAQSLPPELRPGAGVVSGYVCDFKQTFLDDVSEENAAAAHRHFHYLGSPRPGGIHLGVFADARRGEHTRTLLVLLTFSRFDLGHLAAHLPDGLTMDQVLVLSRQIAFSAAPRNAISFALALARQRLGARHAGLRMLVTYTDPNVGFTGVSYRADNWALLGREQKKRYLFLDGEHITDRELMVRFGTADYAALSAHLGCRLERSRQPIEPLAVWARALDGRTAPLLADWQPRDIEPLASLVGVR